MALHRIRDFDPDYKNHFENGDIKGLDVYSGPEKVGSVEDILVDESGQFRYLIINTGAWIFGKKVLLPIGRARVDLRGNRVNADNLTKAQVEMLPEFNDDMTADYDHEEQVRKVYRPAAPLDNGVSLDSPAALGVGYAGSQSAPSTTNPVPTVDTSAGYQGYDRDTYDYQHEPDLYQLHGEDQDGLKLYQERLVANKTRQKTGEVTIGKNVQTETASVSVPIEKERIVIQRNAVASGTAVTPGEAAFQEGEVARMEVYEETADVRKEAFVREEVHVQKVVDQETVTLEEKIRREELNVDTEGNPQVGQPGQQSGKRV
ncbi:MAG: DUF2382 domain-containing protein [Timaviella obliquedivisa GSE-PSE-MK23-08B]|jgi:uncharacterized protein (TIGR02271 family)|nr:DUF2382 domain-containing protein [Timaviella obliquedivisa GSE-PSE-MK23-08B]